jgi:hypothetical protein
MSGTKATTDMFGEDFYLFADNATGMVKVNPDANGFNMASLPNLQSKTNANSNDGIFGGFGDLFNFVSSNNSTDTKTSGGSLGGALQGIGAVTGALASIYGIHEQKKYQDEVLGMEKERVAKNEARRDAKQAEYDKVWG